RFARGYEDRRLASAPGRARRARLGRAPGPDCTRRPRHPRAAPTARARVRPGRRTDRTPGLACVVPRRPQARPGLRQGDGGARRRAGSADRLQGRRPAAAAQLRQPGGPSLMGLFTGLLTLPLAPVRGTVWVAEQLAAEAERELQAERSPRQRLKEAERQFELGAITVEEYEAIEDELLAQLDEEES